MNEINIVAETVKTEARTEGTVSTETVDAEIKPVVNVTTGSKLTKPATKKPFKIIIPILIVVFTLLIAIGGILATFLLKGLKHASNTPIDESASLLMFYSDTEDTSIGTLYYQAEDGEKIEIAKNVCNYSFTLMPKTQKVYYTDNDSNLYVCTPGEISEKLGEHVDFYTLTFSEDEKTCIFVSYTNERNVLYRKELDGEREKICSDVSYLAETFCISLSSDGKKVYYCTETDFYVWDAETGEDEKLASDIVFFEATNNAYSYYSYNEEKEKGYTYIKTADAEEAYKIDAVTNEQWCQDGHVLLALADEYYSEDLDSSVGDLYFYYSGDKDGIRIASDVTWYYSVSDDGRTVYYIDSDENLYQRELPEINEKTAKNPEKIKKQFDQSKKVKLAGNTTDFRISKNGKNVLSLDDDDNLYVHVDGKEKTKIGIDVSQMFISVDRVVFLTNDGKLYTNSKYTTAKDAKEENILIAENVTSASATPYCQNVFYTLDSGQIMLLKEGTKTKEFISDVTEFDKVMHVDGMISEFLYEKVLTMEDLAGYYYIESEECLLEIASNGNVKYYYTGEPNYASVEIAYTIDKYESELYFNDSHYYTFKVNQSKEKSIYNYDITYYLNELTKETFDAEVAKQKKAEEERIAKEKRMQELEEKGRSYYRNGYYVSDTDTIYSAPSTGSATTLTYNVSGTKSVYDYEVSDDEKLWLKVRASTNGRSSYYWVLAK